MTETKQGGWRAHGAFGTGAVRERAVRSGSEYPKGVPDDRRGGCRSADLVVLPELFSTGYELNIVGPHVPNWPSR